MMLESSGYAVVEAGSREECLACLAIHPVDCVLLDINLSGMRDWEVCRRIKDDLATAHITVVIQTVRSAMQDQAEMRRARPDGFLNKPFTRAEVLRVIALAADPALTRTAR